MDTSAINQYELIGANEQDALLRLLVNASVFRDFTEELRSKCYLIFLKRNGEFGELIPCPVVSRRFEVKNHLNEKLITFVNALSL